MACQYYYLKYRIFVLSDFLEELSGTNLSTVFQIWHYSALIIREETTLVDYDPNLLHADHKFDAQARWHIYKRFHAKRLEAYRICWRCNTFFVLYQVDSFCHDDGINNH